MYTSAVVRNSPCSMLSYYSLKTRYWVDYSGAGRNLRRRPPLPHVLRRHWVRRHPQGRHRPLRPFTARPRHGGQADQSTLQRGHERRTALGVHPAAEVRGGVAWGDESGVL